MSNKKTNKKKSIEGICTILGLTFPKSFENGSTVSKEWIYEMIEEINQHNDISVLVQTTGIESKEELMKMVFDELSLQWHHGKSISSGGTIQGSTFQKIYQWLYDNIELPNLIGDLKYTIMKTVEDIYLKYPSFLNSPDLFFEESDFSSFSQNENWLLTLRPIWRCLYPGLNTIDWKLESDDIKENVISELSLSSDTDRYDFLNEISEHLLSANRLLEEFCTNIEELEISRKKSHSIWAEGWDDSDDDKGKIDPINADTKTWQIKQFVKLAKQGNLDIDPIYQRDFVWNNGASQMLINSILMGIPLPSIILHEIEDNKYQIIDGKQRTTSILKFIGALPEAINLVKNKIPALKLNTTDEMVRAAPNEYLAKLILSGEQSGLEFSEKQVKRFKRWKNDKKYGLISKEEKDLAKRILPFSLKPKEFAEVPILNHLSGKFYHEIRDNVITISGKNTKISDIFEEENAYQIPVIIYGKDTKPKQIRRVFKRYNTQGTSLNPTEVNNAAYQSIDAMRFTMAISRIRPERGEELLPGIYDSSVGPESLKVEAFFNSCQLPAKRFEWAKLVSIILGLLYLEVPRKKKGGLSYLPTGGLIKAFFESESDKKPEDRKIIKNSNCTKLAEIFGESVYSLNSDLLWDLFQDHPTWSSTAADGKWSQPAAVSMVVASIICHSSGVNLKQKIENDDVYDAFEEYLSNHEPLGQTQAPEQWGYYAQTATDVCAIFGISKDNLEDKFNLFCGYNVLEYFDQIINAKKAKENE